MRNFTKLLLSLSLTVVCVGGAKAQVLINEIDFSKIATYSMWHADGVIPTIIDNTLQYVNAAETVNEYDIQYEAVTGIKLVEGGSYKIRLFVKGSKDGDLLCVLGNWTYYKYDRVYFSDTEQAVDITIADFPATINNAHILIQSGKFVGTTYISKIQVFDMDETPCPELEEYDISLDASKWTGGWGATASNDASGNLAISLTGDYQAGGYKFNPAADLSKYNKVCVIIEDYPGGWGQIILKNTGGDFASVGIGTVSGTAKTFTLQFDNTGATAITELCIQGGTGNPTIKVSRIYFVEKPNFLAEGKAVEFNSDGFIPRANLAYYADDAKVEFTITAAGDYLSKYFGWGIGKFESAGTGVQVGDFALKNAGDNVYQYIIGDFKTAFNADANGAGDYGIGWPIWGQGTPGQTENTENNTFTRKSINVYPVAEAVSVGVSGFATWSFGRPVNVKGVVKAYGAKYDGSKIVLTPIDEVPAGAGVIIEGATDDYDVPTIRRANVLSENELLVSDGSITGDGVHIFALGKKDDKVGFAKVKSGVQIPSGKAYLYIATPPTSRDFIGFGEDDTTGIESVEQATKADNQYFNLAGQRVAQPTKGLYIVNGKKVIIK